MVIIDGKETAMEIKQEIAKEVKRMMAAGEKQPHLAAILVGHDGGSETYVANKVKACDECGFKSTLIRFEDDVTEDELLQAIDKLNHNDDVDGFIVQLPLPRHIDEQKVIRPSTTRKTLTVSTPLMWAACQSDCLASVPPLHKAFWHCSNATVSKPAASTAWCWAEATSWANQ